MMMDPVCQAQAAGADIVGQFVFGSCGLAKDGPGELARLNGGIRWPVTWIEGDHSWDGLVTGSQAFAVKGTATRGVSLDGQVAGYWFADEHAEYCLMGNVTPRDASAPRGKQTRDVYERMETALGTVGMEFRHVVRTWMFLSRLLEWYDEFNGARTQFYEERKIFDGMVPASTGIGAGNIGNAALTAAALAIKPRDGQARVRAVASPQQCEATAYRSSFSRAVEVATPGCRTLYVSGTASIGADGRSLYEGDIGKQIGKTMEVLGAILNSRGMDWAHVTRAVAYFRGRGGVSAFHEYCRRNSLRTMPVTIAAGDICRGELLFEMELDAAVQDSAGAT